MFFLYPGEAQFKKQFYRLVDSKEDVDGEELRNIEMKIFFAGIKVEMESTHGVWNGSEEHNSMADKKIAKLIRNTLKSNK